MGRVGVGTRVGLGCLGIRGVWRGHGGNTTERVEKKVERRVGKASCRHRRAGLVTRQEHSSACQLHSYVPQTDACTRDMRYACGAALAVCHACIALSPLPHSLHVWLPVRCVTSVGESGMRSGHHTRQAESQCEMYLLCVFMSNADSCEQLHGHP